MRPGSASPLSPTQYTPFLNGLRALFAAWIASRVLPTPPGPVSVVRRELDSRRAMVLSSSARPTKLVKGIGILPDGIALAAGAGLLAAAITGVVFTPAFRCSYRRRVCSDGSRPSSARDLTQRPYAAAAFAMSPC